MLQPNYSGKIYTSETDDKEIRDLKNINDALKDTQFVILTSKVTVGCDHTNQWDTFFIDAGGTGRGCSPRDLLQQLGRFRVLTDTVVNVLISSYKDNRTTNPQIAYSAIMTQITDRRNLLWTKYAGMLALDVEARDGDLVLSPDWISQIFAYNKAEHAVNFVNSLCKQATDKGFIVNCDELSKSYSEELAVAASFIKSSDEQRTKAIYQGIKLDELNELIADCHQSIQDNDAD